MNSGTLCSLCCFSLKTDKTAVLPVSVNLTFLASGVVSFPYRLTAVCAPDWLWMCAVPEELEEQHFLWWFHVGVACLTQSPVSSVHLRWEHCGKSITSLLLSYIPSRLILLWFPQPPRRPRSHTYSFAQAHFTILGLFCPVRCLHLGCCDRLGSRYFACQVNLHTAGNTGCW